MELLCIRSYLSNGFRFQLWTYSPKTINAPADCIVRDAAEILPPDKVFAYRNSNVHGHGKQSYAGFSDIFRYKLLYEYGGIWTDMDITCLKAFDIPEAYFFRYHHKAGAVGNFMKCPPQSAVMQWCYAQASEQVDEHNTDWMLPVRLLNEGIQRFGLSGHIHSISNNDSFPEVAHMLTQQDAVPESWKIIHWMNEEWRRFGLDKNAALPGSVYFSLLQRYGIPVRALRRADKFRYRAKLHPLYYYLTSYYHIYKHKFQRKPA